MVMRYKTKLSKQLCCGLPFSIFSSGQVGSTAYTITLRNFLYIALCNDYVLCFTDIVCYFPILVALSLFLSLCIYLCAGKLFSKVTCAIRFSVCPKLRCCTIIVLHYVMLVMDDTLFILRFYAVKMSYQ